MSTPQQYQPPQPQYAPPQQGYPQPVQQPYPPQMQQPYPPQQYAQPQYQQPAPQQYTAPAPQQAPPANYQAPSADDFLMGGGGAPSAKFLSRGDTTAGRITERPKVEQQRDIKSGEKKFWNDGSPQNQLVVTVQTNLRDPAIPEDDGRRRLFIKAAMKNAVQEAVGRSGARGLEVGGYLSITFTHELDPKGPGMSPPKQYRAEYTSAANAELMGGQQPPAPAPAVPQYAQPAPQPVQQQPQFQAAPQQYAPQPMPPAAQQYAAPTQPQQQYAAPQQAPAGPSPEQVAAAQHDPAARALVAQIQGQQQPAPALAPGVEPPF